MTQQRIPGNPSSMQQEAQASWTAYQATGRHLTGAEVRAWLTTWGTEQEAPLPQVVAPKEIPIHAE